MRVLRIPLFLLLALLTRAALAQPEAPTAEDLEAAAREETAAPNQAAPERAPDDYEASEQISEDLSVSFPVDI